jgi:HSP20 family protein
VKRLLPWKRRNEEGRGESAPTELARFRSELDRVFSDFFRDPWTALSETFSRDWKPTLDVVDAENEITIRAELPGLEPKDVDITLTGTTLILSGEKREESKEEGQTFFRAERRYGSFRRAVPLPHGVDENRIRAEFRNGVLIVYAPKKESARPKRIRVESEVE